MYMATLVKVNTTLDSAPEQILTEGSLVPIGMRQKSVEYD